MEVWGRTRRGITSSVSKKTVLLEYLVDIKHWYEGMKACARYEGAMLVGKYIESN